MVVHACFYFPTKFCDMLFFFNVIFSIYFTYQCNLMWWNFQCKICETNTILYDLTFNAKFVKPIQSYVMYLWMQILWNQYNLMWCNFQCKICQTITILYNVTFSAKFVKPIQSYVMELSMQNLWNQNNLMWCKF